MPIENIKWKELECTGTECQKRRGQEAGRYGLNNTTKIASEMLWNVEPFVRKRGARREMGVARQREESNRRSMRVRAQGQRGHQREEQVQKKPKYETVLHLNLLSALRPQKQGQEKKGNDGVPGKKRGWRADEHKPIQRQHQHWH